MLMTRKLIQKVSIVLIFALIVSFTGPFQTAYAANNDTAQTSVTNASAEQTSTTAVAQFSQTLVEYSEQLEADAKSGDVKALRQTVKALKKEMKQLKKDVKAEFRDAEKRMDRLGVGQFKGRSQAFEEQFDAQYGQLDAIMNSLDVLASAAKDLKKGDNTDLYAKLDKLKNLINPEQEFTPIGNDLPIDNATVDEIPTQALTDAPLAIEMATDSPIDADLAQTVETALPEELLEISDTLASVVDTYEYVKNNFDYEPYYGSRKGAIGTFYEMAGNDIDQASLLIGLLRQQGIPARYVTGTVRLTPEQAMNWTGAETMNAAVKILASAGTPTTSLISGGELAAVQIEHTWVEAYVAYDDYRGLAPNAGDALWVPLDPSFKVYKVIEGADIKKELEVENIELDVSILSLNRNDDLIDFITNGEYTYYDSALAYLDSYIEENSISADTTPNELLGGKHIVPEELGLIPLMQNYQITKLKFRYSKISEGQSDLIGFGIVGDDLLGINFTGDMSFEIAYKSVELYSKRVSLCYLPATQGDNELIEEYGGILNVPTYLVKMIPVLKINGEGIITGDPVTLGNHQQFQIVLESATGDKQVVKNDAISGGIYNIGLNYQKIPEHQISKVIDSIGEAQEQSMDQDVYSDAVMGEILNAVCVSYYKQVDIYENALLRELDISQTKYICEATTGLQPTVMSLFGVPIKLTNFMQFIDVDINNVCITSEKDSIEKEFEFMIKSGMMGSYLENLIWEEATGVQAVSSIRVMQKATEQNIPVYVLNGSNINGMMSEIHLDNQNINYIKKAIDNGKTVIVATEKVKIGDWKGAGYIVIDSATGSGEYMISGGLSGGAVLLQNPIDYDICNAVLERLRILLFLWQSYCQILEFAVGEAGTLNPPSGMTDAEQADIDRSEAWKQILAILSSLGLLHIVDEYSNRTVKFPYEPSNFIVVPIFFIRKLKGTKNGEIWKWEIPLTNLMIFEWNEATSEAKGRHYHVVVHFEGDQFHYYPGSEVPKPFDILVIQ